MDELFANWGILNVNNVMIGLQRIQPPSVVQF